MGVRLNPPPGWPPPPPGFVPPPGWQPDPTWPPPPPGWVLFVQDPRVPDEPPPPPYAPWTPSHTNGFALASLILSLLGGALLGLIFGAVALRQIRHRNEEGGNEDGRGLAIAGIVISLCTILLFAGIMTWAILTTPTRDATGDVERAGDVSLLDLELGDCFVYPDDETVSEVRILPCAEPHDAEIFKIFEVDGEDFPGDRALTRRADSGCTTEDLEAFTDDIGDTDRIAWFTPTSGSWRLGNRKIHCVLLRGEGEPSPQLSLVSYVS